MEYIGYLCIQYEYFKIHISPKIGGVTVCLAVRIPHEYFLLRQSDILVNNR